MMFTHSRPSKWILIMLLVTWLIGACGGPAPTEAPPAPTEAPALPSATEPPAPTEPATEPPATEASTEPPATEQPVTPVSTEATPVEPAPVVVHEYGQGGAPELCDPANPAFTPAEQLEIQETDSTILDGATALFVEYVNEKEQMFRISVHGIEPDRVRQYLTALQVCLEAINVGPPSGIDATSPPLDQFLQDTISEASGLSLEELQVRWEKYVEDTVAAGDTPTLRGFLESLGLNPDEVLQNAVDRAQQAIEADRSAGLLTDEQATDLNDRLKAEYEAKLEDSFSFTNELSGEIADELRANPVSLAIEPEWLDVPEEQQNYMIFSAWDPTIYGVGSHWYMWKKNTYVDAQLYVSRGKAGPTIFRWENYCRFLSSTSKVATGWTIPISGSSSAYMWYRLKVYGSYSTNVYTLYGTWRGTSPDGSTSCGHP